jgi:hypothetical protein
MTWLQRVALVLAAVLVGLTLRDEDGRRPAETVVRQCLGLYEGALPEKVQVARAVRQQERLIVYVGHLGWTGEIRCALYPDGWLDEARTVDRKIAIRWTEPPMPASP